MSATCDGCKFWRTPRDVEKPTQGECRRSAPSLAGGRSMTKAGDTCYLHHPKLRLGEGKFTR